LLSKLLLIAAGGAVGAVLRYLATGWAQQWTTGLFPVGTLTVNLIGCFVIGLLSAIFSVAIVPPEYRLAILVGLLGSFTTFSTFGLETFDLLREREVGWALGNILVSNTVGLAAVGLGYRLAERAYGVT
jgi:CrcB protein